MSKTTRSLGFFTTTAIKKQSKSWKGVGCLHERKQKRIDAWIYVSRGDYCVVDADGLVGPSCGVRHFTLVNERPGKFDWMKKKSIHRYRRWLSKRLQDRSIVNMNDIPLIVSDFCKIVGALQEAGFVKKNASRYDYNFLRVCSRRGIKSRELKEPADELRDLKEGKTKDRFNQLLYRTVYPKLGWDRVSRRVKYYNKWKASH